MKKIISLVILLLLPILVFAKECDSDSIKILSMEKGNITGLAEEGSGGSTFDGKDINLNVILHEVGDSITYNLEIQNDSDEDVMLDIEDFLPESDYLEYSVYSDDNTNIFGAHSTKIVKLNVRYSEEVPANELKNGRLSNSSTHQLLLSSKVDKQELEPEPEPDEDKVFDVDAVKNIDVKNLDTVDNPKTGVIGITIVLFTFITVGLAIYIKIKYDEKHMERIFKPFILLLLLVPLYVYAVCECSFNLAVNVVIEPKEKLFDTIKTLASEENSCVTKYEGEVTDQVGVTVTASNVYFDKCADKRNVIFNNMCWQVVRTTETGGTKLIYNGEVVDGKCESTRENQKGINYYSAKTFAYSTYGTTPLLFGSNFSYDLDTGTFKLEKTFSSVISSETANDLIDKYTCGTTEDSCTDLYLADSASSTLLHSINYRIQDNVYGVVGKAKYESDSYVLNVGYMSNDIELNTKTKNPSTMMVLHASGDNGNIISMTFKSDYLYSDSIEYTGSAYVLSGNVKTYSKVSQTVGKYTVYSTESRKPTAYYVLGIDPNKSNAFLAIKMTNGSFLSTYNIKYYFADNYTFTGSKYVLTNPSYISLTDYLNNYAILNNKYVCKGAETCNELYRVVNSTSTEFTYYTTANTYRFANNYVYNNGSYTIYGDIISSFDFSSDVAKLQTHRYVCFEETNPNTCENLAYIYKKNAFSLYYILLNGSTSVSDYFNNLLSVNSSKSRIMRYVDNWYENNIISKADKLEDTVYCGDRTVASFNGFDPNANSLSELSFNVATKTNLVCQRPLDRFAVANDNAKLTYPIGLLTKEEVNIINDSNLLKAGTNYWLMSPYDSSAIAAISSTGFVTSATAVGSLGVRPVISLNKDNIIISGSGLEEDPWVIYE